MAVLYLAVFNRMQGSPADRCIEYAGSEAKKGLLASCGVAAGIISIRRRANRLGERCKSKADECKVNATAEVLVFISGESRKDLADLSRRFAEGTNRRFNPSPVFLIVHANLGDA